ncbi:hypothetical protein HII17_14830 [Thalassotalea sp. M1531]|uniref:Tetratricopeptide repeat protein n=1 Tax=Thalassotalea algicola TaxID=2716224 RepID=A0A7Y0LE12_9GAMM|nr:hypothetical protein [Thalassotalea algicola]NMP32829.1 hypothetical protein [Thalassotalea algicola]
MRLVHYVLMLLVFVTSVSFAAEKKTYALTKRTYKALTEVNELTEQKDYSQAISKLNILLEKNLSAYEHAQTWFIKGSIYYQQDKIDQAYNAFEQVIRVPEKLSEVLRVNAFRTLTQLSLSLDKHEKALKYGKQLLLVSNSLENDHALLAQAFYRAEQYKQAATHITTSLKISRQANKVPKENILLLQNAIYFEFEDHANMLETLKELTKHYPKPTYLLYMSSVYGQLGDMKNQTILMETLFENGNLTKDNQLVNLASLYVAQHVPHKGAKLLENAINSKQVATTENNLSMLSQAWLLAAEKDKAINAMGEAAALSKDGELYLRQAYLYFDDFNWQYANNAANKAINKGFEKGKQLAEAYLLVAMSQTNLKNFDKALVAGEKALNLASSKKLAKQWLRYIHSEKDKYAQLKTYK